MPVSINYSGTENEVAVNSTRLKAFLNMTPAEVRTWVDAHIVDDGSGTKAVVIDLAMLVSVAAREIKELRKGS